MGGAKRYLMLLLATAASAWLIGAVGTAAANSLVTVSGFAILVSLASLFWLGRNRQEVEIDQNATDN
jgi:uncharacterized membrane protein YhiD involved in acid resistance